MGEMPLSACVFNMSLETQMWKAEEAGPRHQLLNEIPQIQFNKCLNLKCQVLC